MLPVFQTRPVFPVTDTENAVYDRLDALRIPFFRTDHPPVMTMEACAPIEETLGIPICKNLFLCNRQKTEFYLLVMPGNKHFSTKILSEQLSVARLSFASGDLMPELLGTMPGSLSVLSVLFDAENRVRLLMDRDIAAAEWLGCHPCKNTSTLKIRTSDIINTFLPVCQHDAQLVIL